MPPSGDLDQKQCCLTSNWRYHLVNSTKTVSGDRQAHSNALQVNNEYAHTAAKKINNGVSCSLCSKRLTQSSIMAPRILLLPLLLPSVGPPFLLPCPFTSSSFARFYFFPLPFLIRFTYFLLLSIPPLSTIIVPLHFQVWVRRRRLNLGLVVGSVHFVLSVLLS